jgi:uroporphyrinogen-III synthase
VSTRPLEGYTIGVTADRRADEQMKLLGGRGAECVHGPVIKTHPVGSEAELRAATEQVIADPPGLAVLTTGLGVRSWLEAADAIRLGDELRDALGAMELLARGPKATGALVTAGFDVAWTAPRARYDDIVDVLAERGDLAGQRIAVQLDGAGAGELCDRIEALGFDVIRVPVYRWSLPEDTTAAERLIRGVIERRIDALTFTAKPAVENFFEIATFMGVADDLVAALATVDVFCVGPVCATGFDELPHVEVFVPERHRLGAMVQQIAMAYAGRSSCYALGGTDVRVQGRLVVIDDGGAEPSLAYLSERERALLDVLLERPGAVHSKRDLLRRVWQGDETDEHLVEVTVARLRQRLGPASEGIETVVRRGYRVGTA